MSDKIIQVGTTLTIDEKIVDNVRVTREWGLIEDRDFELWDTNICGYGLPVDIRITEYRADRKRVYLAWEFSSAHLATTFANINPSYWNVFEALGYTVIHPVSKEIPLLEAPDRILSPREIVLKHFLLQNGKSHKDRAWAEGVFGIIEDIMDQHEIVFYQP